MSAMNTFNKIGYRLFNNDNKNYIKYKKERIVDGAVKIYEITFDVTKRAYYKTINGLAPCWVTIDEHIAINQQFREMDAFLNNDLIQSKKGENHGKGFKK